MFVRGKICDQRELTTGKYGCSDEVQGAEPHTACYVLFHFLFTTERSKCERSEQRNAFMRYIFLEYLMPDSKSLRLPLSLFLFLFFQYLH